MVVFTTCELDANILHVTVRVQTLPMLASGAQLLPCGPMHVSGTKYYQNVIMTDVVARLHLEESHQYSLEDLLQEMHNDVNLSPAAALARSSIHGHGSQNKDKTLLQRS